MEKSPRKTDCSLSVQEISHLLRDTKFHYRGYKSLPLVPTLRQINPPHILTSSFRYIHLNIGA